MSIQIITSDVAARMLGVKVLVHSRAGMGKTTLCATAPAPLVVSAESGMLALAHLKLPTVVITKMTQMYDVYRFLTQSHDARHFATVCLDSISELAEVLLVDLKRTERDPRRAYGDTQDQMTALIRAFRDIPGKHVYFSAKQEARKDDMTGRTVYGPGMPGQKLGPALPYFFDEVFAMDMATSPDGTKEYRYLRCTTSALYEAKDRSGTLDTFEPPDLSYIINKIYQGRQAA